MKKVAILLLILSGLLGACASGTDADSQNENVVSDQNDDHEYDIYISHTTECLREEEPELYVTMQSLLEERAEMQFAVASPDIALTSENTVETEEGLLYYPLKDRELSIEKIRNQLLEVYDVDYVDGVLVPYYFETSKLYVEQDGQLYAQDVATVLLALRENWTVWEVNENYYYIQGFEDADVDVMVILTVIRSEDGSDFLISDEVEINLE